jgi:aldehyde:ferredoxin oxidoreductase
LSRKDDTLPVKIFSEPLKKGPFKGEIMDREKFERMKDEYYELRGWDKETGIPKEETLIAFGLEDLVNEPGHPCRRH